MGEESRDALGAPVTEQQHEELRQREALLRGMFEAVPDTVFCVDRHGVLLDIVRREETERAPLPRDTVVGQRISTLFGEQAANTLMVAVQQCIESRTLSCITLRIDGADNVRVYDVRFAPWGDTKAVVICRDVTELNTLREQLVIADRLLAMSTLAGGIAHEVNNPLTCVMLSFDSLRALHAGASPAEFWAGAGEIVAEISSGLTRIKESVRDLQFFRNTTGAGEHAVDISRVLDSALQIASSEIRYRARIKREYTSGLLVHANEGKLSQVFLNLVVNAAQSITEGAVDRNEIAVRTYVEDEHGVAEVCDTGCGIRAENLKRVFEPFFTTKPAGVGSGLGLAISKRIVESFGGRIEVDSQVVGATFRVVLPLSLLPQTVSPPPSRARETGLFGRFLVVDDEAGIARALRTILGEERTVACTSGEAALDLIRHGARFDAIVCDLIMPNGSGMDVYEELERTAPEQLSRIVFLTGGAFTERTRAFLESVPNVRLDKPFNVSQLVETVARIAKGDTVRGLLDRAAASH